jgi:predicted amidohydrolase
MWDHVGLTIDGWAIEKLGEFAQRFNIFVSGQMLESDPKWPGRIFNTAFILNDSGDVIHRYRKIQCADTFGAFPSTTPGSILSRYLDLYGYEGLFPVCDTKLGRLATAVCFDMNFPELHRAFALRGADLLLHPTAEPYNLRRAAWENMRQVRAYENCMYILSAALGGEFWDPHATLPTLNGRGHSKIVRFDGLVQAVADGPGPVMLSGQIDLKELRTARARLRSNLVLWDDPEVYGHVYASRVGIPDDLADEPGINPYAGGKAMMEVIERYAREGIFVRPSSSEGARNAGDALLEVGLA